MQALFRQTAELARSAGRSVATEVACGVLVGALSLTGGGFLIAAGYGRLARAVGADAAAALIGVVLILIAGVIVLIRAQRRAARARAVLIAELAAARTAPPVGDPLPNLVFSVSYELARYLAAKRRN